MKKILLILLVTNSIMSFSQTLDPTFGSNGGIVLNQFSTSNSDDWVTSAALQTDGNIIVIGRTSDQIGSSGFISRVYPTGSLDTSFNNYGYRTSSNILEAVTIQSDGKILVAGGSVVTRLNTDGSLDTSFNSTGGIAIAINNYGMTIKTLSILSNGKIIAGGYVSNGTETDFALVRLNSNGTIDTLFDLDGKATLPLSDSNDILFDTKIQIDGKIVVAGRRQTTVGTTTTTDYIISRFNTIGSLDTSFGTNGIVTSTTGIQSLDFQSDGKIVTAGNIMNSISTSSISTVSSNTLYANRYNINGSIDATFSVIKTPYATSNIYQKPQIKCLASGKILLSGSYYNSSMANRQFALNQFNSNGTSDTSFSTTGTVYLGNVSVDNSLNSLSSFLIVKPDGKIITGGTNFNKYDGSNMGIEFIQTTSTGVSEYYRTLNLKQGTDIINDVIEQPNGKTVVMVSSKNGYNSSTTLLIRHNQNGTIDNSFGAFGNGIEDLIANNGYRLKKQLDEKILVSTYDTIYRYTPDGFRDTTFGNFGRVAISHPSGSTNFIDNIYASNDGKVYVLFDNWNDNYSLLSFGITRLNNDGSVDTSYGINGIATTRFDFYTASEYEYPTRLILNSDNSVVVVGPVYINSVGSTTVLTSAQNLATGMVKFNALGQIDSAFGTNGKKIIENNNYNYPYDFLTDSSSNFYLNANITGGVSATTKILSNGTIDTSFGNSGVVTDSYFFGSMIMQPNGKIVKAGSINSQFGITRYNTNGTLDTTFGTAGTLSTPIYYSSSINKLLYLSSNKLLAVGRSFNGSNTIMAMTRYTNLNLGTLDFTTKDTNFMVYPNPIEEQATFTYSLKEAAIVTIEIIDLQGKVVQSVLNVKEQGAGEYQQEILLPNAVASGNYILRFSSPEGNQSIKIIKK